MGNGERPKRGRLTRSGDFDRAFKDGTSSSNRHAILYRFPRGDNEPARLGVSVSRKVGGAVDRNKVKRALREQFWQIADETERGIDYVVVARPSLLELVEKPGADAVRECLAELIAGEAA
jgi:ribonuclease P protein component